MNPILASAIVGFVIGPIGGAVATILGVTVLRGARDAVRSAALAFAGGFILAAAFMEFVRRGIETNGSIGLSVAVTLGGLAAGAVVRGLVSRWVGDGEPEDDNEGDSGQRGREPKGQDQHAGGGDSQPASQARQIAVSLAVVNLLEGLPVGVAFAVGQRLGLLIGGIMVFENFTEALSVVTELSRQGSKWGAWRMMLLSAGPTATLGIGAIAGALAGALTPLALAGLLGAGAGIMLYAVVDDIMLDAHRLGPGAISTYPLLLGVVVAVALSALTRGG